MGENEEKNKDEDENEEKNKNKEKSEVSKDKDENEEKNKNEEKSKDKAEKQEENKKDTGNQGNDEGKSSMTTKKHSLDMIKKVVSEYKQSHAKVLAMRAEVMTLRARKAAMQKYQIKEKLDPDVSKALQGNNMGGNRRKNLRESDSDLQSEQAVHGILGELKVALTHRDYLDKPDLGETDEVSRNHHVQKSTMNDIQAKKIADMDEYLSSAREL